MPSLQPCPKRPSDDVVRTAVRMGTFVTIHLVGHVAGAAAGEELQANARTQREQAIERAFAWFDRVEECCTRFDSGSEVMRLAAAEPGVPVSVSTLLFEAVQFALAVAEESGGAFDPTVGHAMETRGFNREYRSGRPVHTAIDTAGGGAVSYRDVRLDSGSKTITLMRPLVLDLGAVAKGLAVDLAARELSPFENFAVNAGGDLYLGGRNPEDEPWSIGIRHPRSDAEIIELLRVSNRAVCTSGDYEKRSADGGHHILDPRTGASAHGVASVTVIASTAMLADALATAAFVLGPEEGSCLFERLGVNGLIFSTNCAAPDLAAHDGVEEVSPALIRYATRGMHEYL